VASSNNGNGDRDRDNNLYSDDSSSSRAIV